MKSNSEGSKVAWSNASNERTDRIHILDREQEVVVQRVGLIAAGIKIPLLQRHSFWHAITSKYANQIQGSLQYVVLGHTIWETELQEIVEDEHLLWAPAYEAGKRLLLRSAATVVQAHKIVAEDLLSRTVERAWANFALEQELGLMVGRQKPLQIQ